MVVPVLLRDPRDTVAGRAPAAGFDGAGGWLNCPPLTPAAQRGKVVLVEFWTYTCIHCCERSATSGPARSATALTGWSCYHPILDEATANLDALTAQKLMRSLESFTAGRTVLIISHHRIALEGVEHVFALDNEYDY